MRNKMLGLMLLSLLLLIALLPACNTSARGLPKDDQAAVYAVVVRQVYTVDHTFGVGNPPPFPVIYLLRATDDTAGDPHSTKANSSLIPESIQEAIVAALDDLPAEFKWIDDRREVIDSRTSDVQGRGAIITLGNTHLQEDRSALVAASIYFASAGGGGATYVVKSVDGIWQITGTTGVRWIS